MARQFWGHTTFSSKGTLSAEEGMQGFQSHVSFVFTELGIRIMNA